VNAAKAYHVQHSAGTGARVDAGIWPDTKGIVLTNLSPGAVYGGAASAVPRNMVRGAQPCR